MEGTVVADRYELRVKLGAGATAAVYRAHDRRLGREVAIKLLHEIPNEAALRRFEREARIASRFRHPDVIEIYDVGDLGGRPFLVMELVTAPSLAAALVGSGQPPTIAAAVEIGARIAGLLAAAHEAGLVHRDVKPANVFLDGPLAAPVRCRLSDFGLAFMVEPESESLGRFTLEGVLLGTPYYIAPEQAAGRAVGPPVDVYSLGCMLHEMITGRPPFVGNLARVLAGHMYLPPVALRELESDSPAELEQLVLELLDKAPERRPAARDVAKRLGELGGGAPRARATPLQPRRLRAITAPPLEVDTDAPTITDTAPVPAATPPRPTVALELDDPALEAALRERSIAIAADAPLALGPLDGEPGAASGSASGATSGSASGAASGSAAGAASGAASGARPRLAIHPHPTPAVIAHAIRSGAAGVIRWPGSADDAVAQILRAWRSIHRIS